ncbi:MAG TPA: sigma-70 family RNA polymerase sigma factor [Vicinamibacteria bacterium]|nr:sigma-70 family RNA polymerase sigma factor [Vicinamibacteria bacterium]
MAHPVFASAAADDVIELPCPVDTEALPDLPTPEPEPPLAAPILSAKERFEAIYKQYGSLISAIVGKVGRRLGWRRDTFRAGLLQDIEQEVLLDIWKQISRGQTIEFPTSYIYTAAYREALRSLRREATREMEPIDDSPAEEIAAVGDPFQSLSAKESLREIILGLKRLAPDRAAAVRASLAGFGLQELMVQQGWSYQKARNLLFRGMDDLRRILTLGPAATSPRTRS